MSRQVWLGSLATFAVAITLIVTSRSISEFLYSLFFKTPQASAPALVVATLTAKSGLVSIRRTGKTEFIQVSAPLDFYHLDQIKVERSAKASLQFVSGWHLDLQENFIATFELYRPTQEKSPALFSITKGKYEVAKPGALGMLFIMQDKKVFSPGTQLISTARVLELKVPTPAADAAGAAPTTNEVIPLIDDAAPLADSAAQLPSAATPGKMPDKIKNGDEETLSSAYIEQMLSAQATALRKCQMNSMRDNKVSTGSLLFSLTIAPTGKVDHSKVLQDKINNPQLTSCTTSVIERVTFKSFEGLPITLTYPLEFK